MKTNLFLPAVLAGVLALPAAAMVPSGGPESPIVAKGISEFALDLYSRIGAVEGNVFCSPFSISTALAMTYAGARGETEKQMAGALHFPLGQDRLHKGYRYLAEMLNNARDGYEINIANRLWIQDGLRLEDAFLAEAEGNYGAEPGLVDFEKNPEPARVAINRWVEKETREKIRDLVKPGMIDGQTRLVLANAIYFKGLWAVRFDRKATSDGAFKLGGGKTATVPMMHRVGECRYGEDETAQVLELPYRNGDLAMVILLPRTEDGLAALEAGLTFESLEARLNAMDKRDVKVAIPRFRMTSEFSLGDALAAMGMKNAFTGKADFSGITAEEDLQISAVVHKAFVDVNEEGTVAAAATAVTMRKAVAVARPQTEFVADHPFLFLIRDNRSRAIVFLGRVANPAL